MADELYVVPDSLGSILAGIDGAIALLNDTFSEVRLRTGRGGRAARAASAGLLGWPALRSPAATPHKLLPGRPSFPPADD